MNCFDVICLFCSRDWTALKYCNLQVKKCFKRSYKKLSQLFYKNKTDTKIFRI